MYTYIIVNKKTGKPVSGTDYRYRPPHQITSDSSMLTFDTMYEACAASRMRTHLSRLFGIKLPIAVKI